PVLAQRITRATGIPVHVRPESLLPAEAFVSRLEVTGHAPLQSSAPTVALDGGAEPLARTLDRVAAQLGVLWRYADDRLEFYRTETRAFDVRVLTLQAAAEASLGLRSDASRQGFASTSSTELVLPSQDLLATVRARIEPFLSRAGVVVRSEEHTSELQSRENLVCRLLLEKKNIGKSPWSARAPEGSAWNELPPYAPL